MSWFWSTSTFKDWWSGQSTWLDQHPAAHLLGGVGLDATLRMLIVVAVGVFRLTVWRPGELAVFRLLLTGAVQALWELNQVEEYGRDPKTHEPRYPYAFAALDVATAVVGACVAEVVWRT